MYLDAVWWFRVILEGTVFLVGVPGNLLIIQVYAHKRDKVTPHIFVIGLAVADLSVCLCRIITVLQLFPQLGTLNGASEFFCRVPPAIDAWTKHTSVILTSVIAVDRYYAICRPHVRRLTTRHARYAVLGCFAASMLLTVLHLFIYGIGTSETGGKICSFVVPYWIITMQFIVWMVLFVISLVLVVVLYVKVYKTISKMSKVRPGNPVVRGAHRGPNQPYRDDETAIAEQGFMPNQVIPTVNHKVDLRMSGEIRMPELESHEDQLKRGAVNHKDPTVRGVACTGDKQQTGTTEFPLLNPLLRPMSPNTNLPTTSHIVSRNGLEGKGTAPPVSVQEVEPNQPNPNFHKKTTLMLLLTSVVFVVTLTPVCIVLILYPVIIPLLSQSQGFRFVVNVASYFSLVNHAANPILYSFVSNRFRTEMVRSLRGLCRRCC